MTSTDFEDADDYARVYLPSCPSCMQRYRAERELRLVELRSERDALDPQLIDGLPGLTIRQRQVLRNAVIERAMRVSDQIYTWETAPGGES